MRFIKEDENSIVLATENATYICSKKEDFINIFAIRKSKDGEFSDKEKLSDTQYINDAGHLVTHIAKLTRKGFVELFLLMGEAVNDYNLRNQINLTEEIHQAH